MPSTRIMGDLAATSGGQALVSGDLMSGRYLPISELQLVLDAEAPGPIYVGLPPPNWFSGYAGAAANVTMTSGGTLTSGGFNDGVKMMPGDSYAPPKARLTSGVQSVRIVAPGTSSGARLFWEWG